MNQERKLAKSSTMLARANFIGHMNGTDKSFKPGWFGKVEETYRRRRETHGLRAEALVLPWGATFADNADVRKYKKNNRNRQVVQGIKIGRRWRAEVGCKTKDQRDNDCNLASMQPSGQSMTVNDESRSDLGEARRQKPASGRLLPAIIINGTNKCGTGDCMKKLEEVHGYRWMVGQVGSKQHEQQTRGTHHLIHLLRSRHHYGALVFRDNGMRAR